MLIKIVEINPEYKKDLNRFIDLNWKVYDREKSEQREKRENGNQKEQNEQKEDYNMWVPPLRISMARLLDVKNNPFYHNAKIKLFIATCDGQDVGRVAAIINHAHNQFHNENVGHYGFFESINNQEVANSLFIAVEKYLKENGAEKMLGPFSPSTNYECGLLIRGQSQHPTIQTTWNPRYYQTLHEEYGLTTAKDLVAYALPIKLANSVPEKVSQKAKKIIKDSNFTFRDFDLKNFDREVDIFYQIYNSAWEKNWGFVPMGREEFRYIAEDMKMILDPRFTFFVEKDGVPAGFMLALPDINHILKRIKNGRLLPTGIFKLLIGRRFLKSVRILALGVRPEFRKEGIFALFTYESFRRGVKYKILGGEASWILEDNEEMNRPWKEMGAPLYRRWRIYQKDLL